MNPCFLHYRNFVLTCTGTVQIKKKPSVRVHVFYCFFAKILLFFIAKFLIRTSVAEAPPAQDRLEALAAMQVRITSIRNKSSSDVDVLPFRYRMRYAVNVLGIKIYFRKAYKNLAPR